MKQRNATICTKENQICRKCKGNGFIERLGFDQGHGHSQEPSIEKCQRCKGTGLVFVEMEIKVTVTPKISNYGSR